MRTYLTLAGAVAFVAWAVGISAGGAFLVFLLAAVVLLKPFLPLVRRLPPHAPRER